MDVDLKTLLHAGVHYGHSRERWHPKMAPFVYTVRDGLHIIDVRKTLEQLNEARHFLLQAALNGNTFLFVGTKQAAREVIEEHAKRCGAFYVTKKWIGGMLTNFDVVVTSSLEKINYLQGLLASPIFKHLPPYDQRRFSEELRQLMELYGGLIGMSQPPDVIYLVDPVHEHVALSEAKKLNITTIAIVDTDGDPTDVTIPIPANDDSIKSISLITSYLVGGILEGKELAAALEEEEIPQGNAATGGYAVMLDGED